MARLLKLVLKTIIRIKKKLIRVLGMDYKFSFDGLKTRNNMSFLEDQIFLQAYNRGIEAAGGQDFNIPLRVHQAIWCAARCKNIEGDIIELGTGRGFLFSSILEILYDELKHKKIYLVDTFLPFKPDQVSGKQDSSQIKSRIYANDVNDVELNFSEWKNVTLLQGMAPQILENILDENLKISFLHVDLNFSKAEIDCLNLLWPYLSDNSTILLDDYANPGREEQYVDHNNFFSSKDRRVLTLASGQGLVIK